MRIRDRLVPGACCLALLAGPAMAAPAAPPPARLRIAAGLSPRDANGLRFAAHVAALRAAWSAHHGSTAPQNGAVLALVSGKILRPQITVGTPQSYITMQFGFTADTTGFNSASFTFTAPVGGRTETINFSQGVYSVGGTAAFSFDAPFPYFTAPGSWTLTGATLADNAGNTATYDAAQLAQIFSVSAFSVVNHGAVAAYPPVVSKGMLSSTTISLSAKFPQLRAAVTVADSPTGVTQALLFLQPPGQTYQQAQISTIAKPVLAGAVPIYDDFYSGDPTGSWIITQYTVCDFAGNCSGSSDPAVILSLFGTNSITVTN